MKNLIQILFAPARILGEAVKTDSNVSAMRVIVLYGCLLSFTCTAVVWLMPSLHDSAVGATAAFAGISTMLLSLKLVQNGQENSTPTAAAPKAN